MSLFDANGQRLYITQSERNAFLEAASRADREVRTFCMVMAYTGCRISEALALTGKSIDFGVMAITQGIPLNMVSKWMGHASLEVTAIYANALGEEQRAIAARMWG